MRPIRFAAVAGIASLLALGACQAPQPAVPPDVQTAATASPPKPFRERRGWAVAVVPAALRERAHCVGGRLDTGGLRIAFLGGDPDSGFRISGFAGSPPPGATERVSARFDDGERKTFEARVLPGPVLEVIFPTLQYDNALYPFARARSVEFESQRLGPMGVVDLEGSSWTINATDECRRMHVVP